MTRKIVIWKKVTCRIYHHFDGNFNVTTDIMGFVNFKHVHMSPLTYKNRNFKKIFKSCHYLYKGTIRSSIDSFHQKIRLHLINTKKINY